MRYHTPFSDFFHVASDPHRNRRHSEGNPATVRFLLDRKADPNLTDYRSKTALDYAEEYRHPAICELLRGIRKE